MTAEMVFEETYTLLNKIGVVDTKREFCRDWLNRGDSYFRCLKHNQKPPSVSKICEKGNDVLCRDNCAFILDKNHNVVAKFEKRNGLYAATLAVRNFKYSGFRRQVR